HAAADEGQNASGGEQVRSRGPLARVRQRSALRAGIFLGPAGRRAVQKFRQIHTGARCGLKSSGVAFRTWTPSASSVSVVRGICASYRNSDASIATRLRAFSIE